MAEFALMFPLFLLVLFAIIDIGRYIFVTSSFNQGAREGARFGSVEKWQFACPASVPSPDRFTCTAQVTSDVIAGAPGAPVVTVTCATALGVNQTASLCGTDDLLTVNAKTATSGPGSFHFLTPIIGQILVPPPIEGEATVVVQ